MNWAARICGIVTNSLTSVQLEFWKERKNRKEYKSIQRDNSWKLLKFGKRINLQSPEAELTPDKITQRNFDRQKYWIAMPSSRGSSQPRDRTQVSHVPSGFFTIWTTKEVQKKLTPMHKSSNLQKSNFGKLKTNILKAVREKWHLTSRGKTIQMTANFSPTFMKSRKKGHNIFQMLKENSCQFKILYPVKMFFRNKGEVTSFSDEEKLRGFVAYCKRMTKSSQNQKEMINKGIFEYQEGRKYTANKKYR